MTVWMSNPSWAASRTPERLSGRERIFFAHQAPTLVQSTRSFGRYATQASTAHLSRLASTRTGGSAWSSSRATSPGRRIRSGARPTPHWGRSLICCRGLHDATRTFDARGHSWSDALADPMGGPLVCHNDVELSNVVFRDGIAVALIDFEAAAPGRPVYDLAQFARLCVPIEDDFDQSRMGWLPADRPARRRLIADVYGLDEHGRTQLLKAMDDALDRIEAAARRGLETDPDAAATLQRTGGIEKYERRRRWWGLLHDEFATALS